MMLMSKRASGRVMPGAASPDLTRQANQTTRQRRTAPNGRGTPYAGILSFANKFDCIQLVGISEADQFRPVEEEHGYSIHGLEHLNVAKIRNIGYQSILQAESAELVLGLYEKHKKARRDDR